MKQSWTKPSVVGAALGIIFGYFVLHPFAMVVQQFFHMHENRYLHLHWNEIVTAFGHSFSLDHWPQAAAHAVFSGIIGYLVGRVVSAHRAIDEQLRAFSVIGVNTLTIIHDLNNPLTGIIGNAELLKARVGNAEYIANCERIEQQATRISQMLMDIRMTAQSAASIELSRTPTELQSFLQEVTATMSVRAETRIRSTCEAPVSIDRGQFERVIWNLVRNADEALQGAKEGRIELTISESGSHVLVAVSDNGPGMPQRIAKDVFKLGRTFQKKGGSGIGLYNSKKIVEAHGGKIWVSSEVGKGTTVYVKLSK